MKLEETIIILPKSKIKAGDGKKEGKYLLYRSSNKIDTYYDEYIIDTEAIIVGTGGNPSMHYNIGKCAYTTQCLAITSKGTLKNKYIYYYLLSQLDRIQNMFRGMTIKQLDKKEFFKLDIPIIEVDIQDKIIENLDIITNNIQSKKEQVKKLEQLVKSQFVEMFGNPIINDKKFEFKQIGEVTKIVTGTTPDTNDVENWNGGINWITPAEIKEDTLYIYETERKITEKGQKSKSLTLMPKGTVIFSTRAPIGKTAIAGTEMCCNQGFKNCICSININNIYLYYVLKNNTIYFNNLGTGATFKELSKRVFEKVKIAVPPITLQNQFSEIVKQIDKQKFEIEKSLKETQELYESLMEEYFKEKEDETKRVKRNSNSYKRKRRMGKNRKFRRI